MAPVGPTGHGRHAAARSPTSGGVPGKSVGGTGFVGAGRQGISGVSVSAVLGAALGGAVSRPTPAIRAMARI